MLPTTSTSHVWALRCEHTCDGPPWIYQSGAMLQQCVSRTCESWIMYHNICCRRCARIKSLCMLPKCPLWTKKKHQRTAWRKCHEKNPIQPCTCPSFNPIPCLSTSAPILLLLILDMLSCNLQGGFLLSALLPIKYGPLWLLNTSASNTEGFFAAREHPHANRSGWISSHDACIMPLKTPCPVKDIGGTCSPSSPQIHVFPKQTHVLCRSFRSCSSCEEFHRHGVQTFRDAPWTKRLYKSKERQQASALLYRGKGILMGNARHCSTQVCAPLSLACLQSHWTVRMPPECWKYLVHMEFQLDDVAFVCFCCWVKPCIGMNCNLKHPKIVQTYPARTQLPLDYLQCRRFGHVLVCADMVHVK